MPSSAPINTAGSMSISRSAVACLPLATNCNAVQLLAAASGAASATRVPTGDAPARDSPPNIQAIPAPPARIASQVRVGRR